MQRLSPNAWSEEVASLRVTRGDRCDLGEVVSQLVAWGYRREHQVEHRGELAVRGGIVDVFCPTADAPVRIDLWGDEVDRLTQFSVADQRSITDLDDVRLYPAREMRPDAAMRERAAALALSEPWCAEHMERLSRGELFDGMESWLPWLSPEEIVLPDLLGPDSLVLLCEPRRLADRAADITAETDDLTRSLAVTWGVRGPDEPDDDEPSFPRLHVAFDRLLARCEAAVWTIDSTAAPTADGEPGPHIAIEPWVPVAGDASRLVAQLRRLVIGSASSDAAPDAARPVVVVAAEGDGSAARLADTLNAEEVPLRLHRRGFAPAPGGHVVVAPLESGFIAPAAGVAVLPEAEFTGRRRVHRAARRRTGVSSSFEDLSVGDFVVHHHHGIARYAGLIRRSFGDDERDYLELEFRGTDRLYLPTEQIDFIRPYIGGETPRLSPHGRQRLPAPEGQSARRGGRDRPRAGGAVPAAHHHGGAMPTTPTAWAWPNWPTASPTRPRLTSAAPSLRC